MTRRVVGIIGGMGPEATILLQQRVLTRVRAEDDSDHLPLLIDMNPQVPSRIAHLIDQDGPSPGPVLADMARRLAAAGATALGMPCNTAHHYADEIAAAVSIPFLNMVDLSVAQAATRLQAGDGIGFLASPAVHTAGVFDEALAKAGLRAIWPSDPAAMLRAIRTIKAAGPAPEARQTVVGAAEELAAAGASLLFVACSEFSLIAHHLPETLPIIDTVDVLSHAIQTHTLAQEVPL